MGFLYLALLIAGIGCILLLDRRFRLFFWHDPAVALLITVAGTALFLLWDIAGIVTGVFLRGDSAFATGIVLAPELPLEEPVFLVFLVLCTMITFTGCGRVFTALSDKRGRASTAPAARSAVSTAVEVDARRSVSGAPK